MLGLEFFYSANNREIRSSTPALLAKRRCAPALPLLLDPEARRIPSPGPSRAPCAGRYATVQPGWGDTGTVPAPVGHSLAALWVTSDPCTCYRSSPSLPRVGPAPGAPRSALPRHRDSHRRIGEKRGAGRSRGRQPGPTQLSVLPDTGSAARPAPRTGTARPAPASAALSRARH